MLRVSLLGNMGADPEVRYSAKGTQIVTIRVAVNQVRTGPDGERQENTEWFRVKVTNPRFSDFVQRLNKGTRVLAIGRLDIGHYQSKEGEPRTSFDVWADEVQVMSSRTSPGMEPFGVDADSEAHEPVAAGVSSLNGAPPAARATTNGKGARTATRAEPAADSGASEELEDLPF